MKSVNLLLVFFLTVLGAGAQTNQWIGTWGASPAPQLDSAARMLSGNLLFQNQTLREIVHTSIGGATVRVRLSNAYGRQPVTVGSVHIGLVQHGSAITAGSDHAVTFAGRSEVMIPSDALVLSDPIQLDVPSLSDVAISLYFPKAAEGAGIHYGAQQTSFIGAGDQAAAESFQESGTVNSWVFLTGLDVEASGANAGTVVAFGDSITDGAASTMNANHRWPNILANRLIEKKIPLGVLDEGIGGNRILHDPVSEVRFGVNALSRFDRDVLAQPGVRYVVVLEGINDIGHAGTSAPASEAVSADDLIAGLKQMIERAHEKGIKIIGCTLTPFEGTKSPGYYTPQKEVVRKAVNEWIRTGHSFDGVIDFEKAVQDPSHPDHMNAAFDSGDHLHPGDAGYKAMGEAIDLALFQ